MTEQGDFAAHRRDGDDVIKTLNGQHPAGSRFAAVAQNAGATGMNAYLSTLRAAGVTLPSRLSVESTQPLAVRHRWVTGPTLLDHASINPPRFIDAVIEIAGWVRALDATDARVDTNLVNFCLAEDHVVLVDVLPPLIPSMRPEPSNLFEELFDALCFDTTVTLDAMIGYAARALLHPSATAAAGQREDLACLVSPTATQPVESFSAWWFRTRAVLALRALAGQAEPASAHTFFALTSVRAFRDLPEAERARRIRQADQAVKELALT
ncbi:hypothetical protein Ga0074812_12573 [Parafrankia irregularis]|uniref:Uncharacterized protein n=1 Tax=Parafrankia irregularis TaxID=795642 RepID=A0A0S4QVL0_9ACTN|nr:MULTISPECIES: hypothetical protein [Frankiaceae]KPM50824.1 hypothetical protein ACG83_38035 [Frankia sp. R43]MBE3204842.1 hypothetical protein [Parafrankia sp. CH37]CUU59183.1 hypothetical protein Ga0074812_12573 [Parafrankia irregularis]